jgi:tRNA C32,U32 (ribose-2'-O)-methylase TrmJ
VIFGPEDFGLSNAALDQCHAIVTIPTNPEDASLNLAQAALIIAYEVFLAATTPSAPRGGLTSEAPWPETGLPLAATGSREPLAPSSDLEKLFDAARRMLQALHTSPIEGRTNAALARFRALLLRAGPRKDEVAWLQDLFEHLARAVSREPEDDR